MRLCRFFFNDTATTEIYTLSLHDALPIYAVAVVESDVVAQLDFERAGAVCQPPDLDQVRHQPERGVLVQRLVEHRSEEHTSELQSRQYLVCRLLLEKKNDYTMLSI